MYFLLVTFAAFGLGATEQAPQFPYLNTSVDPCDNFYEYTCGNFKNVHPLPPSKPVWDHFGIVGERLHSKAQGILEKQESGSDSRALKKAKTFYKACLDGDYQEKLRVPEVSVLKDLTVWPLISNQPQGGFDWSEIGRLTADYGVTLFFTIQVLPNLFNTSENAIYLSNDELINPGIREVFHEKEFQLTNFPNLTPLEDFILKLAKNLSYLTDGSKSEEEIIVGVKEVVNFMRQLRGKEVVQGPPTPEHKVFVSTTVGGLQDWTDAHFNQDLKLNWLEYLNASFSKSGVEVTQDDAVIIADNSTLYAALQVINKSKQEVLKNFAVIRLLTYTSQDSNSFMRQAFEEFYRALNYTLYSREEYCLRKTLDYPNGIGFTLALLEDNEEKLSNVKEMVSDLQVAFEGILREADWLDDITREKALQKASKMISTLGYPNFVKNSTMVDYYYENVRICKWEHFGNAQRLRAFRQASNFALLGAENTKYVWQRSPLEVNAYYNTQFNRIMLPIGILNPIFYSGGISALDYGRIGTIIGHEMTHGFDNQGKNYDENGSVVTDWWTDKTNKEFEKRENCFKEQYGKYYIPEINAYVDPESTRRENIADNGGLREAYKAFTMRKGREGSHVTVEGYTAEQLFFIGYGTMWCMTETTKYLEGMNKDGSHPPGRYRVIGPVSNMKEFAEAFKCPEGSKMNPDKKCILW